MQQYYPIQKAPILKNRLATASLALSIISFAFMIMVVPMLYVGLGFMSCAGQSPEASGVDWNDPVAMEKYIEDSKRLGTTGIIVAVVPPVLTGITAFFGLLFGVIGLRKPYNRGQAVVGIVLSSLPFIIMTVVFAFGLL